MTNLEIIKRLKTAKDLYDKDTKPGSDKNGGYVPLYEASIQRSV